MMRHGGTLKAHEKRTERERAWERISMTRWLAAALRICIMRACGLWCHARRSPRSAQAAAGPRAALTMHVRHVAGSPKNRICARSIIGPKSADFRPPMPSCRQIIRNAVRNRFRKRFHDFKLCALVKH